MEARFEVRQIGGECPPFCWRTPGHFEVLFNGDRVATFPRKFDADWYANSDTAWLEHVGRGD